VNENVPVHPVPNTSYTGHVHVNGGTENFRYVFNEQVTNPDGSLTVYAAHEYLLGPTAVGDLYIGKSDCGVTAVPVTLTPPSNTSPPTISGMTTQGKTLIEAHGGWTNNPTAFSYQWLVCDGAGNNCMPVTGATSQTYTLGTSDIGHTVRVQESATNPDGSGGPSQSVQTSVISPPPPPPPPPHPPGARKPVPCAGLTGVALARCQAKQRYLRALAVCGRKHEKKRAKCQRKTAVDYHREIALINCRTIKNPRPKGACIRRAQRIRR
jgi:hypothetical protein